LDVPATGRRGVSAETRDASTVRYRLRMTPAAI
jgi:hypothetical protein